MYNDPRERPSLIKTNKLFKNFAQIKDNLIIEPSSEGEDSEADENLKEASIRDVVNNMVDFNAIMTVKNLEDFPKEATPGVIFLNLDDWMNQGYMRQFIEDMPCFR
jgi:hypothetical protein